jgi:hypothetical protein
VVRGGEADSGIIMNMNKNEKKKGGEEKEGEVEVVELTKRQKGLVGKSP